MARKRVNRESQDLKDWILFIVGLSMTLIYFLVVTFLGKDFNAAFLLAFLAMAGVSLARRLDK